MKLHFSSFDLFSRKQRPVGFSQREEGAQHAAKLQLSVLAKSRTNFVKTRLQGF